jgi:hypothetical protein
MHGSVAETRIPRQPDALIWTVGHGTRATDDLARLLMAAGATTVIDVRRYPAGRRQPRFARQRLEADLPSLGISYEWWGEALGGRRPMPTPLPTGRGLRAGEDSAPSGQPRVPLVRIMTAEASEISCSTPGG